VDAAAGRWTWLVIAAYVQLHLARDLGRDVRLPWQQPCAPSRLTPARVRRGFRRIRKDLPVPASAPHPAMALNQRHDKASVLPHA
jgi:hypothetical protein